MATTQYDDASLRQLRAPARDAEELSGVLADPQIGGFAVTQVIDRPAQEIRLAVEDFLTDRRPDDLVVVYLSCHGLIDPRRRLYFAATDTRKDRLAATGVESDWLLNQMEDCRARRQVVVLDCCFSGAFAHGAKGDTGLDVGERFQGQGRGRVVLTASRGSEYSFEGEPLPYSVVASGSAFTSALIAGIRTGAADSDNDGYIYVDDAYTYAFDRVQAAGAQQTPQRWLYGAEGQILLARNPAGVTVTPAALPAAIRSGLDSPVPAIRVGAVTAVGEWLADDNPARRMTARDTLQKVADTDIPLVTAAAQRLLKSVAPTIAGPDRDQAADEAGIASSGPGPAQLEPPPPAGPKVRDGSEEPESSATEESSGKNSVVRAGLRAWQRQGSRTRVVWTVAAIALAVVTTAAVLVVPKLLDRTTEATTSLPAVFALAISPNGKLLATGDLTDRVQVWDTASGAHAGGALDGDPNYDDDSISDVEFSPDGRLLASAHNDGAVRLWDVAKRKQVGQPLAAHQEGEALGTTAVAFSPDSKVLASGGYDRTIRLWNVASHDQIGQPLTGHTYHISDLAFSPDGNVLASAGGGTYNDERDGTVRLWDPETGQPIGEPLVDQASNPIVGATSLAFSPDGKTLAVGYIARDGTLWNLDTRQPTGLPLRGYSGAIVGLAYSPDGQTIAGGEQHDVYLWPSAGGQAARKLSGHTGSVTQLAFTHDGKLLASASRDGTVRLQNPSTGELIRVLK